MSVYSPDPNFYDNQIKDLNTDLEKFQFASYDSATRGYTVDGRRLTKAGLDSNIRTLRSKISKLEADKKKFGQFGPAFGPAAKSNTAGKKFIELYNKAARIKVTDFESSVANFKAWQEVTNFVANNKDIRVVATREASVPSGQGFDTRSNIQVVVDPSQDPVFANALQVNPNNARARAVEFSEQGVVESRAVTRGSNPNTATTSTRRVVTNQAELDRRLKVLDDTGISTRRGAVSQPVTQRPPAGRGAVSADTAERQATATPTQGQLQGSIQGPFLGGAGEAGLNAAAVSATGPTGPVNVADVVTGGGGGGGGGAGGSNARTPRLPRNWEAKFREMFPQQAWLLDLDKTKYPQLNELLQRGITNRSWETPESQQRFAAELQNTDFYQELASTDKVRTIKSLVGDLGFESTPFNSFLTTAMNFGWDGDVLKSEVYKEAFRKDDNGAYVNPTAITRVKASSDWLKASGIGKAFFNTMSDNAVEQRLTGVLTDEDLVRQQRELAKTKYSHLSNLIDQGFTLEELSNSYRQRAASVLERAEADIDMGSTDFESAFNFGEEGKKRMMTTGEWEIMLRSDAKYGWDKTENAKQEARGLASSIAQAFGRIM